MNFFVLKSFQMRQDFLIIKEYLIINFIGLWLRLKRIFHFCWGWNEIDIFYFYLISFKRLLNEKKDKLFILLLKIPIFIFFCWTEIPSKQKSTIIPYNKKKNYLKKKCCCIIIFVWVWMKKSYLWKYQFDCYF